MAELVVTFVNVPHALPHDEGWMAQFTGVCGAFWNVTVSGMDNPTPATETSLSLTVIVGQLLTQGPLPPVAQPLASARINKAAANRKFFIIVNLVECVDNKPYSAVSSSGERFPLVLQSKDQLFI